MAKYEILGISDIPTIDLLGKLEAIFATFYYYYLSLEINERFNDLIRLSPGLGYKLDNNWKFELYLIFNSTKNITETNNKSNDFILRLRVFNAGSKKQEVNTSMNED